MTNYNILILSAGRRVELVQAFQRAAKKLNILSNVIAVDCSELAPALYFADRKYLIPSIDSQDYIDSIINICNIEEVSLIIPTIDHELLVLAENKSEIETKTSAKILVSDLKLIRICRDKIKTSEYLQFLGFDVPKIYTNSEILANEVQLPLFIKPISGSSSIDAYKINTIDEFKIYTSLLKDYMIQEYVGGKEYSVDAFLDFDSTPITIVPRLRIATRAGEISKGKIIKDKDIIETVRSLLNKTNFIGHITIQLKKDKSIKFIEINPRFGGGAPMSIAAGADSCEALYNLLLGKKLSYNEDYSDELIFLRFDSSIMIDSKDIIID